MSSPAYSQSSDALASLFLTVSKVVAKRITAASWPLTVPMQQTLVERNKADLDNWWGSTREVQLNVLAHHDAPLHQLAPLLPPEMASTVLTCASSLVALPESNLPFWSVFGDKSGVLMKVTEIDQQVSDSEAAANWTASHLLLPALLAHLMNLPSLEAADTEAAQRFATEVMHVATAHELSYIVTVPLAGIEVKIAAGVVRAGDDVTIRRLSPEEQGFLLADGLRSLTVGNTETLPYAALEICVTTARNGHNPDVREKLAKWLCALQLHGFEPAGSMAIVEAKPSWVMAGRLYDPVTLPRQPRNWSAASTVALQKVRATVESLKHYNVSQPRSQHDLALHRFCTGAARGTSADALLDFVIALESLLLPYDEVARHSELRYRFHIHGAHYLSKTRKDRKATAKQLLDLYDLRSRLVHGGKYPAKADVEAARIVAGELTQRGLLRAVTTGFPTKDTFKDMVLGV